MTILGLENNYYLSGNDIWIKVFGFSTPPVRLELIASNSITGDTLPALRMYSPDGVYSFNVSLPIRALQPEPNHMTGNTLQTYSLAFTAYFEDDTTEAVSMTNLYFIRGGVNKRNKSEWFLAPATNLVIAAWAVWEGINLPNNAQRLQGSGIVNYIPLADQSYRVSVPGNCNYKIIKFLNSLGGYQFYIFEYSEETVKTKGKGSVNRIAYRLREDRMRSIGKTEEQLLILKTKTPEAIQEIIVDLIKSNDVLLYDPLGDDVDSKWTRLELEESNEATLNTRDRSYQNELTFKMTNYVNRDL